MRPYSSSIHKAIKWKLCVMAFLMMGWFSCHSSPESNSSPPSHKLWDELLKAHVDVEGNVDYPGFIQERKRLQEYLDLLSDNAPNPDTWSEAELLSYWINAYNAFTVKLIADNYPIESIRDLDPALSIPMVRTVWHKKFFSIGGKPMNLDQIEHKILRREFEEPRIHFAINCASYSCPPLRSEAFVADKLEEQLEDQARLFINNTRWNRLEKDQIEISAIFNWFKGDFTKKGNLIAYLNRYSDVQIQENAKIAYLEYDWSLNE